MSNDLAALADAAAAGSVAGAVVGFLGWARRAYRATLGQRRANYKKLARLAPGMSLAFVKQLFGEPTFREVRAPNDLVLVWVNRTFYVQTQSQDDVVRAWSVTSRRRTFRPTLFRGHVISAEGASLEVKIGRTRFSDLPYDPNAVTGFVGAHDFQYSEAHYYGNPGHYLHYVYSLNQSAPSHGDEALIRYFVGGHAISFDAAPDELAAYVRAAGEQDLRRAQFNTVGVVDWTTDDTSLLDDATGPDWNRVRLLAKPRRRRLERLPRWVRRD